MTPQNNIMPWEDVLVCIDAPEDKTEQGVIISAESNYDEKKKPEKGIVVAVGKPSDPKKTLPIDLKPGDLIFYERYTANKIPHHGKDYNFVRFKFVMGVIPK